MTALTPRALCQLAGFMPVEPERVLWRQRQMKFLCDRVELQTPLADDWDWSTVDRLKPEAAIVANCTGCGEPVNRGDAAWHGGCCYCPVCEAAEPEPFEDRENEFCPMHGGGCDC